MITIQPETQKNILVAKASEHLTADDYKNILIPTIKELITRYDKINAVIEIDGSFKGWEAEALAEAFPFARKERHHLHRMAIVGSPTWLKGISTFLAHALGKDLKHFDNASLKEALAWAKEEK